MIALLVFLMLSSAYCSMSEIALFSLPSHKVKNYQKSNSSTLRLIAELLAKPRDLIVTIFMLNTLVNVLIQNTISHIYGENASWLFKVGLPFVLMLLFGEIIPKNFGMQNNEAVSKAIARSIHFFQEILAPIRRLIVKITVPVSRVMFFYLHAPSAISTEELDHALKTSEANGVLNKDEAELVSGVLSLQEVTVKSLMRPREDILFYNTEEPLKKLAYLFAEQECSRLPVCSGSLDHLLGIITAREFLIHTDEITSSDRLTDFLSTPFYVPESLSARLLFKRLNSINQEMAIVVDEYGSISGLITREDLVEQVVGDIVDLRDAKALFTKAGPQAIIASGRMELADLNEYFHINLSSDHEVVTVGGWLIEKYGDIPPNGTKIELDECLFHVLSAEPNRIRRLYIRGPLTPRKKEGKG